MKFHNFIGLPNKYEEWRRNIGLIFKTSTETSFRSKTFIKAYLATYLLICNITKIYCIFLKVMLTNIMLVATSSIHEYNVCKMVLLQKSLLLFCIKNGLHKMAASLVYFLPSSFERRATKLNGGDILFTRSHPQNRSIVTFGRMHVIQNWIATPRHSLKIEGN